MRILLNGPSSRVHTGVGQYLLRLAGTLETLPQVEEVGVAVGWRIRSVTDCLAARSSARPLLPAAVRRAAAAVGRHAVRLARTAQASTQRARWTVFHEGNYVAPRVPQPLVTTAYDLGFLRCPQFMPPDRVAWLRKGLYHSLRRSDMVLVLSEFTRREVLEFFPSVDPSRVQITPVGVDSERFHSEPDDMDQQVRQIYQLPERYALYLGTLEPRKNIEGLLRGYDTLPGHIRRDFPLILAGAWGWQTDRFRALLQRLVAEGTVRYLSYVPQVHIAPLLRGATVFCFPSHYEGFGMPPLEAASCGTPVLCSRSASLPEVMGDAAVYVDASAPEDIACGLQRLLSDAELQSQLRARGLARAAMFTWRRCAESTLQAYRAAVAA